mmetsp:Transcript_1390/g.4035  ORF Transcript_1390/g.4035 Transcript_1390/m.4035 type:complete len:295 (-) Transcript_1390:102-986(-)
MAGLDVVLMPLEGFIVRTVSVVGIIDGFALEVLVDKAVIVRNINNLDATLLAIQEVSTEGQGKDDDDEAGHDDANAGASRRACLGRNERAGTNAKGCLDNTRLVGLGPRDDVFVGLAVHLVAVLVGPGPPVVYLTLLLLATGRVELDGLLLPHDKSDRRLDLFAVGHDVQTGGLALEANVDVGGLHKHGLGRRKAFVLVGGRQHNLDEAGLGLGEALGFGNLKVQIAALLAGNLAGGHLAAVHAIAVQTDRPRQGVVRQLLAITIVSSTREDVLLAGLERITALAVARDLGDGK